MYTVAGHTFDIILPSGIFSRDFLSQYAPFEEAESGRKPLFSLELVFCEDLGSVSGTLKERYNDEPPFFWFFEKEGEFRFGFSLSDKKPGCVVVPVDGGFGRNVVYVPSGASRTHTLFALNNAMMLLFTLCTTPLDTLMIHASVTCHKGRAFVFLGKSGTGKSTHSRLWLENIPDTFLLNDDNPAIRLVDGVPVVFGTPWSGKTPCYKNDSRPMGAYVRLEQAPHNKISRLSPLQAYAALLPSCSCMRWDSGACAALHKTVEKVILAVPGFHLECLPDADAARLSCETALKALEM